MNNKELFIANLEEAVEQLPETIESLRTDRDYDESELKIDLGHAHHHLKFGWHTWNVAEEEVGECSQENFVQWSKFSVGEILELKHLTSARNSPRYAPPDALQWPTYPQPVDTLYESQWYST